MLFFRLLRTIILFFVLTHNVIAQTNVDLIPKPTSLVQSDGSLDLKNQMSIYYHEDFVSFIPMLKSLAPFHNYRAEPIKVKSRKKPLQGIRLLTPMSGEIIPENGYKIIINENGILLKAHKSEQMVLAIQTLRQLMLLQDKANFLPYVIIEDEPRFDYRGLLLDVSRHFMPMEFLKKYIDLMALYKYNYFHWHLTDGAGWRIEIKKYPELTQHAAWRSHAYFVDWNNLSKIYLNSSNPNAYGGYYTQDDAREIVSYAADRGITVIPEIEMPGHSEEVLAVYPQLSCKGVPYSNQNELCIGNRGTFVFLENVLNEIIEIFPSKYIHIGGDEADKSHWKTCEKCQALKQKEGLKSEEELQSYSIRKMDQYLSSKGRKMIGWDEILEGGLSEGATVMSWRGEDGGIKAANAGHDVIMTPLSHLYFDYYLTDPRTEPAAFGGYVTMEKVYSYDPIPTSVEKTKTNHILGAQANVWTEYMRYPQQVEYMTYPRALALAEVNWSKLEQKNFADFQRRLQQHYKLLKKLDVNYYPPSFMVEGSVEFSPKSETCLVSLKSESYSPQIRYTIDGTLPTAKSTLYNTPIELNSSTVIKAASFVDTLRVGRVRAFKADLHKGIGKKIKYITPWNEQYPAQGENTLIDGNKGGITYQDKKWQGFTSDIEVVIDLNRRDEIKSVSADFMQMPGPGVYLPSEFVVSVSENGKTYREIGAMKSEDFKYSKEVLLIKNFIVNLEKPIMARYVKVVSKRGTGGFLFTDEIVIN